MLVPGKKSEYNTESTSQHETHAEGDQISTISWLVLTIPPMVGLLIAIALIGVLWVSHTSTDKPVAVNEPKLKSWSIVDEPQEKAMTEKFIAGINNVRVFYNNSSFDDDTPEITPNDFDARAHDKQPLRELDEASFINISSYDRGINGVMIDLKDRPKFGKTPTVNDFIFRSATGQDANRDPFHWNTAPSPTGYQVIEGAGLEGSDRVIMTWDDDSAVKNGWLQITVLPNANTGLYQRDVFYFGSLIGKTPETAPDMAIARIIPEPVRVNESDYERVRNHLYPLFGSVESDNPYDINRDQKIDDKDLLLVRRNFTNDQTELQSITAPLNPASHLHAEVFSPSEAFLRWHDHSATEAGYQITGYNA